MRKKSALCLLRLYRKYPEILTPEAIVEPVLELLGGMCFESCESRVESCAASLQAKGHRARLAHGSQPPPVKAIKHGMRSALARCRTSNAGNALWHFNLCMLLGVDFGVVNCLASLLLGFLSKDAAPFASCVGKCIRVLSKVDNFLEA